MRRLPLTLVTGPANAEKAAWVLDAYEAAADRAPLLVVPTFADVQTYRRELAERGMVFGADVSQWRWVVNQIVQRAGVRGRPLSTLGRERLCARVVASTSLGALGRSAQTPGFADALLGLVDELEAARIDPGRWYAAVRAWGTAQGEDLGALYSALRRGEEDLGRMSSARRLAEALDRLRVEPRRWRDTPVFLYGFDDLTPVQRDAVETLAVACAADVVVSLPHEAGRRAFAGRGETLAQLSAIAARHVELPARADHYAAPELHALERGLFDPIGPPTAPAHEPAAVRLLRGGSPRAELELVAAHVARLLREGVPAEEVAVVLRRAREHAALVASVFAAADIPIAIERRVPAGHTALGRGVLALARCALAEQDATADDLLTYLRTPGLLRVVGLADALEVQLRTEGVGDAAQARRRFEGAHFHLGAIDRVREAARAGFGELCARLAAEGDALLAAPFAHGAPVLDAAESIDATAAAELRRTLAELGRLADLDARLAPDVEGLLRTLADVEVRAGARPGPGRVVVADPLAVRGRRVRALFVCGLVAGRFPAPPRPDPLLSDADRRALNAASGLRLPLADDATGRERALFYAAASRPTDALFLSWHAADEDGNPAVRSPLLDDVEDVLKLAPPQERALGAAGFEDPGLAPTPRELARGRAAAAEPVDAPPIAPLSDARVLAQLAARETWSASGLEAWLACPVRWFVERLLRPAELVPDPEPLLRGELAHAVLEDALSRLAVDGPLGPEHLPEAQRLAHEAIERLRDDVRLSANPERARAATRRLEGDVLRYLQYAAENGSQFAPRHFEVTFEGVAVAEDLRISGRVDRVDVAGNRAIVYDYKGATATPQARWEEDNRLQLGLYALALPEVLEDVAEVAGALYQPLRGTERRPRGALRQDADPGLDAFANDRVDDAEFEALLEGARARAVAAVASVRGGRLQPQPDTCSFKGEGCAYPSICRCERR